MSFALFYTCGKPHMQKMWKHDAFWHHFKAVQKSVDNYINISPLFCERWNLALAE